MIFAQFVTAATEAAHEQRTSDQVLIALITAIVSCVATVVGAVVTIVTVLVRSREVQTELKNSAKIHSKKMDEQNVEIAAIKQKVDQPITMTVVDATKPELSQ